MSGDLAEEKRALRRVMREARDALDAEQRVALTVAAVDRLLELPVFDGIATGAWSPATSPSAAS